jgi:Tol biopolymer transport system component
LDRSGRQRSAKNRNDPAVSPTGDRIVFLRKDETWSVGLDDIAKPSQLIHSKGQASELRWSPDGYLAAYGLRADMKRRIRRPSRDWSSTRCSPQLYYAG